MKKVFFLILFLPFINIYSQPTIGLLEYGSGDFPGFVLFNPIPYTSTYLIDKCGYKIREWQSTYNSGLAAYLMQDGSMIRAGNANNTSFNTGGKGGIIEKFDFNGTLTWSYQISSSTQCQHHDICPMPNGNILVLVWQKNPAASAIALGRDPALVGINLWSEKIMELQPTGTNSANIVWEWNAWDHLVQDYDSTKLYYGVVADHPELFNFNYTNGTTQADWMHLNGIDYDPIHDQIIITSRIMCEMYVLDHSTTSGEASTHTGGNSGKGGDILYRWGNPMAYDRGTLADRKLYYPHCPKLIPPGYPKAGNITVFNNGVGRPGGNYSSVDMITPPIDAGGNYFLTAGTAFGPDTAVWVYSKPVPADMYSNIISGAWPMQNGNILITDGTEGNIFEADSNKTLLWDYVNPVNSGGPQTQGTSIVNNSVFKASFYGVNFPGFTGQDLTPGTPIELNPDSYTCNMTTGFKSGTWKKNFAAYPNPANTELNIELNVHGSFSYSVLDVSGKKITEGNSIGNKLTVDIQSIQSGIYLLCVEHEGTKQFIKIAVEN